MKKTLLATIVLLAVTANANSGGKLKPISYKKAYAKVEVVTETAGKNGEVKTEEKVICEGEINIPFYRIEKENQELESVRVKNCDVVVNGVEATVVVRPFSLSFKGGIQGNPMDRLNNDSKKVPAWLLSSMVQAKEFRAFMVSSSIVPKGWNWVEHDQGNMPIDTSGSINKLYEMFSDSSAHSYQSVAILGLPTSAMAISTELQPSSKYCSEHSQASICSSNYTIKTHVMFKPE